MLPDFDYLDDHNRPCWRLETIAENLPAFIEASSMLLDKLPVDSSPSCGNLHKEAQLQPGYKQVA